MVTSCDHLHTSHARYLDPTQMPGHNTRLYADIWIFDKRFIALFYGRSTDSIFASDIRFLCILGPTKEHLKGFFFFSFHFVNAIIT